jgi:hypothetical protein
MATRIIEYDTDGRRIETVFPAPSIVDQTPIVATTTSAQSAAFNAATNLVCIDSDEKVHIKFGENPTATTACLTIAAGTSREFEVIEGVGTKVAVRLP